MGGLGLLLRSYMGQFSQDTAKCLLLQYSTGNEPVMNDWHADETTLSFQIFKIVSTLMDYYCAK